MNFQTLFHRTPDKYRATSWPPLHSWACGIGFYVDGVSIVFKTNPCSHSKTARTRSWGKSGEGLTQHCTGKAKKEGTGGKVAKFMVSIAYGKGVIGVHQYEGAINGKSTLTL